MHRVRLQRMVLKEECFTRMEAAAHPMHFKTMLTIPGRPLILFIPMCSKVPGRENQFQTFQLHLGEAKVLALTEAVAATITTMAAVVEAILHRLEKVATI